jgi:uncharacterized phage protein (TIGR01671 family)
MNRVIKFRGWDVLFNKWIYGGLVPPNENDDSYYITSHSVGSILSQEVVPESVGQFTGLKDKNGNEIYEGDVVLYKEKHLLVSHGAYIECWDGECPIDGRKAYGWFMCDGEEKNIKSFLNNWGLPVMGKLEILGNIYQNPLLCEPNTTA